MTDTLEHDSNQDAPETTGTRPPEPPERSERSFEREAKLEDLQERRSRTPQLEGDDRAAMLARRYTVKAKRTPEERGDEPWLTMDNDEIWTRIGGQA